MTSGGAGDDVIEIGRGQETIDGGGGVNTQPFAAAPRSVSVDLGLGQGTGPGSFTIHNIQHLIGSGFDDTLTAGAGGATLIAGSGHDTLVGGAGDDTLVAGAGDDMMTGGGGADSFVYSVGDGQLTIGDFGAHGDNDLLNIYGYSDAQSITQQGADALVTLSMSDSILLKNVSVASLTGRLTYSAAAYPDPKDDG